MGVELITALVPALLPAVTDGLRGLFARLTGNAGVQPQNVAETIQLMQADTARLQAIAQLDSPTGQVSPWVANIRALQRPVAAAAIILGYLVAVTAGGAVPDDITGQLGSYAQMVTFYLFGDRSYMYLRNAKR